MSDVLMGSDLDAMVQRYLDELALALSRLPASRRDHLVSEIREHIAALRIERPVRDRSDMEALLNRVGLPEDIAAVALEDVDDAEPTLAPVSPAAPRWRLGLSNRVLAIGAAVAVVLVIVVAGVAATGRSGSVSRADILQPAGVPESPAQPTLVVRPVPTLIGETQAEAEADLNRIGFSYSVHFVASDNAAGIVVGQSPTGGLTHRASVSVSLFVSMGTPSTS